MSGILNTQKMLASGKKSRTEAISIAILSLAAFVIVTTEFIIIGLMPTLARDLNISIPVAGQLVTAFAITVVFAGPLLTVFLLALSDALCLPGYWLLSH